MTQQVLSRQERLAMMLDELLQTMSPEEAIPPLLGALMAVCAKAGVVPTDVIVRFMGQANVLQVAGLATNVVGTVRSVRKILSSFR